MSVVGAGVDQIKAADGKAVGHVAGREDQLVKDDPPKGDVQQPKTDHAETHDSAGTEGDLQSAVQTFGSALGGTGAGFGSGVHADVAAQTGEETAGKEGYRNERVLDLEDGQNGENDKEDREDRAHHFVLAAEVSHGAFTDVGRDLDHARGAFRSLDHALVADERHQQRQDGGRDGKIGGGLRETIRALGFRSGHNGGGAQQSQSD